MFTQHKKIIMSVFAALVFAVVFIVATAPEATVYAVAPDIPTDVTLVPGDGQIQVMWSAPAGGAPVQGYYIRYSDPLTLIDTENTDTTYTITGLTNGVEYNIRVAAYNRDGSSNYTVNQASTPTTETTVPDAPVLTSVEAGDGEVSLTWTTPDDGGSPLDFYQTSHTPDGGAEVMSGSLGLVNTYTITGLTNGTEYTFRVRVGNTIGKSLWSNELTETPVSSATIPDAPSDLSVVSGDGTLTASWTAPESNGSSLVNYYISYTPNGGSESIVSTDSTDVSYSISDLVNGLDYTVKVRAENGIGAGPYSSTVVSAPDQSAMPAIVGNPTVSVSDTSAVVSWVTSKTTNTRVDFGLMNTSALSTSVFDDSIRVQNHSVTVSNLLPCTTYSYRVFSADALDQSITSSVTRFTTTGCDGSAIVEDVEVDSIDTTIGGQIDFTSSNVKTKLTIPANLKLGETDVVFQAKKLSNDSVISGIGTPSGRQSLLGEHAYKLTAYSSETEEVNDFDSSLTVSIEYTNEDIAGYNVDSLKIYHYTSGSGWEILSNCTNEYNSSTRIGIISCPTSSFSVFGLFGEAESSPSSSGSYVQFNYISNNTVVDTVENSDMVAEDVVMEELEDQNNTEDSNRFVFTKDLWSGSNNNEVFELQKLLNSQGFVLAEDGPGSPGRETSFFGPRTLQALIEFQLFYSENILTPLGITYPTGYFGYFTRTYINNNL